MGNSSINKQGFYPLQNNPSMGPLEKPQNLKAKSQESSVSAPSVPFQIPNDQLVQSSSVGSASTSIVFQDGLDLPNKQEMNWASQLQDRVIQGYKPTSEEIALYDDIQTRFRVAMDDTPDHPVQPPTEAELEWAQQLELRVAQGYQPTTQEIEAHKDITTRLEMSSTQFEPRPLSWPVSQEELNWATDLQQKVQQGYQPTERELDVYTNIYERYQNEQQEYPVQIQETPPMPIQETPNVPNEEVQWAMDLEVKVKQGYEPTPAEIQQYESIAQRLMAQQ